MATDNIGGEVKETVKILPFMSGWSRLLRKRSEEVTSVSVVVVGQMLFCLSSPFPPFSYDRSLLFLRRTYSFLTLGHVHNVGV